MQQVINRSPLSDNAPDDDSNVAIIGVAQAVWAEMALHGIVPTPHAYEICFAYRRGDNATLCDFIDQHHPNLANLTPDAIESLHARFFNDSSVSEDLASNVLGLQEAADTLVGHITGNQSALRDYGDTLAGWAKRLDHEPTIASLVAAVAALTAETTRAAARNRALEEKLANSVQRINRLRQSLSIARAEASTDSLTAITNRRAFDTKARRFITQTRGAAPLVACLVLFDIDNFKWFNDVHGHQTGDLILRLVARLLSDSVKGRDTVARYGGEEFAVLLAGADLRSAISVARQICQSMADRKLVKRSSGQQLTQVTLSAGVAQFIGGENLASWVSRADAALYRAKELGRNRVCSELDLAG